MQRTRPRKRPCTICRKWFMPDPRQRGRQKTCGDLACQKENHRRQCEQWNRKNRDYFKANYLSQKLSRTESPPAASEKRTPVALPSSRINLFLPKELVADTIGVRHLIILDYIIDQVMRHGKGRSSVRAP